MTCPSTQAAYVTILVGAHALIACSDLPELTYETESLRIGTKFDEPLCRGDLDYLEGVITSLEAQLDATVSDPIEVYIWGQLDSAPPDWCDDDFLGCYRDGAVYTSQGSLDHELVHAVIDTFADPPAFWNEGAAEALVSTRTLFSESAPSDNIDADSPSYATAGHFSRWVLERFGLEKYRALLRHRGPARQGFEEIYGMSIEDAEASYFDGTPNNYGAMIACLDPELPSADPSSWSEDFELACERPGTYRWTAGHDGEASAHDRSAWALRDLDERRGRSLGPLSGRDLRRPSVS